MMRLNLSVLKLERNFKLRVLFLYLIVTAGSELRHETFRLLLVKDATLLEDPSLNAVVVFTVNPVDPF